MRFDQFEGEVRKYPRFKPDFVAYIRPLCKCREELFVLKLHLSEEIRDDVECIGEDVDEIWRYLDRIYGDKGELIDAIMWKVKQLPAIEDENLLVHLK